MAYLGVGLVLLLIVALVVYVAWRLRNAGEMTAGGSMGRQMFGRRDDDWGPKP